MKKLLALLTALMMVLSCTLALAEEAPQGVTITSTLTIDREAANNLVSMFSQDEQQAELIDAVIGILGNLNGRLTVADGAQLDLFLKDKELASLALGASEEGIAVASTLFPSYVLTASQETIMQLMEQLSAQAGVANPAADPEALAAIQELMEAASGYSNEFVTSCQSAVSTGDPEMGEFTFDDLSFNCRVPLTVDVPAIAAAFQTMVDQIESDETIQSGLKTLEGMGLKLSEDGEVNLNVEEMSNVDVTGDIYMNIDETGAQTGATYVVVQVVGGEEGQTSTTNVSVLVDESAVYVSIELPEAQTTTDVTVVTEDAGVSVRVDVNAQGMYFGAAFVLGMGDVISADFYVYVLDDENPLVVESITVEQGGELTMSFDDAGKTELAIEDLMNDSDGTASSGLLMDVLFNGLGSAMSAATEALPEEAESLSGLLGGLMGGSQG